MHRTYKPLPQKELLRLFTVSNYATLMAATKEAIISRKRDYLYQRSGSQNWYVRLQYPGGQDKPVEKSLARQTDAKPKFWRCRWSKSIRHGFRGAADATDHMATSI